MRRGGDWLYSFLGSVVHRFRGMDSVRVLFDDIVPALVVESVGAADHQVAVMARLTVGRRKLNLVDCCSFQSMRRLDRRTS